MKEWTNEPKRILSGFRNNALKRMWKNEYKDAHVDLISSRCVNDFRDKFFISDFFFFPSSRDERKEVSNALI